MSTFIGREQNLATLDKYFQEALQGKGRTLFITGEAGIGKTTFINEFKVRYVDARNVATKNKKSPYIRFAEAKCSEIIGKGEAYAPFIELISRFVNDDKAFGSSKLAEVVQEVGADWFELVPFIGKALKLVSKTLLKWQSTDDVRELAERTGKKEKLVQQYTQILKTMSEKHPLVLFLDDLHWADDSSIYLLYYLAREIATYRILILGTYRPTDIQAVRGDKPHPLKDALSEMHRYNICDEVKLGYFTPDHIRLYLNALFPHHRLDTDFITYLHDLTEGNPLFVTEQLKLLQEIGKIVFVDDVWQLRGTLRDANMPIPTSVEKTIEKRFERLGEDLQETLQYASINGEQFDVTVLAQMLQQDELAVLKKLQTLDRVYQFVSEQKTSGHPTTRGTVYQFIHSLVQKALYGTLSDGIKVKLHAKAAEIIEALYPEQGETFAEELAAHWERGRMYAKAISYLLLAARKANQQAGYQEARNHAQHGLELLKVVGTKIPDQVTLQQQIELLLELAAAEEAVGETKNSLDHTETAARFVEMVEDQRFQGEAFYHIGELFLRNKTTNTERILQILEKSLTFKIAAEANESIVSVLEKMWSLYFNMGKGDYFIERCQEVVRLNQQAQKINLNVAVLRLLAQVSYAQGKYQEAYDKIIEGFNISLMIEESPNIQMELLGRIVEYAIRLNDVNNAAEYYETAKLIAYKVNDLEIKGEIFFKLGNFAWLLNKQEDSLEYYRIAREVAHNNKDLSFEASIISTLLSRLRNTGKFEEAINYGIECLEIREKLGHANEIVDSFNGLAFLFRSQGNYVKTIEMRQQAIALLRKYERESTLAGTLSHYHIDLRLCGQFREAINAISETIHIYQKKNDMYYQAECISNLALCHLLLGHIDEAISLINQVANQNIQSRVLSILISMRYSHILMETGDYKKSHSILEIAVEEGIKRETWYGDFHLYLIDSILLYLAFDMTNEAIERLSQVEKFLNKLFILEGIAMLKDAYAQVYLAQHDLEKAIPSVNEAIILFQQTNSFRLGEAYLTKAAIGLSQQQPSVALQYAVEAGNIFKTTEYYRYSETVLMQARAYSALKDYPKMQECLQLAATEFERLRQPHHLAEAKLLESRILYDNSNKNKEQAIKKADEARIKFEELGLKRLEKEAIQLIETFK